jgi:hypothetical protein
LIGRQNAGPGIENLHHLHAGLDLADQVRRRGLDQQVDQALEPAEIGIGPTADLVEIAAAAAFDHVGRHRPGSACKTDQGDVFGQGRTQAHDGRIDRRQVGMERLFVEDRQGIARAERFELRPFAHHEPDLAAQGIGDHQDIAEHDRRIQAIPPDWLQARLDGEFRRIAEFQEIRRLGPKGAVFRQVPPGLAHQPDRWRADDLAPQHA